MKKKLLFVITKSNWGGAGRYVYDLARTVKDDYDVAVALGGNGLLIEKLENKGIRVVHIPSLGRDIKAQTDGSAFIELYTIFKKERPDIVHLNSSKAGGLGALAARFARVPRIIFTVHGWAFNEPVAPISKFFRWSASLVTLLLSHAVITVSEFDGYHSPLSLKTTTIHNGVDAEVFLSRPDARARLAQLGVHTDSLLVGTIAELNKNKGIDILLKAFSKTKNCSLVIIGDGEDRMMLEALTANLKLESRVHFLGFIDNAATLMKAFDVFVLASRKEGLPYVILEAGEAEVPVIASMVGGIPEIIEDQLSGVLVPAYDTEALAHALNELLTSTNSRTHLAMRLKEKVSRGFGLRGMVQKTKSVYES